MDEFVIRPAVKGARLHDPITGDPLAAGGETKPRNTYWLKCLARGDVVEMKVDPESRSDGTGRKPHGRHEAEPGPAQP